MCNNFSVDLAGAAKILNTSEESVAGFAASGRLPGAKIGRSWVFILSHVEEFLREQVAQQTAARLNPSIPGRITRQKR